MKKITYIDEVSITSQTVLLRVDYNISLTKNSQIADDARIQQTFPTIDLLLKNKNKLIIITYLGRPNSRDPKFSLKNVAKRLQEYYPKYRVTLIDDFLTTDKSIFTKQTEKEILMLENIRFYPQEKNNNTEFLKKVSELGTVFINDAFGQCHRVEGTIVGIAHLLPSYGGLLLKKEVKMISKIIESPKKPIVAILGGAKVSTKINLLIKLTKIADYVLIGGKMANTFFCAQGYTNNQSSCQYDEVENARRLIYLAQNKNTKIVLPKDVAIAYSLDSEITQIKKINEIPNKALILDIGPETQAEFGTIIANANTIVWNGPMGYIENPHFRIGTDFIYYTITDNQHAHSVVGGGDTLSAISKKEYLDKITHISSGGGAMLEFIEKGTLPGIEALKK
ncbi:phosphoglycerate kinase [Candidatus Roizmanbacteria bacterium CG_4_9_14_0_8_um_filter_34_12]|uniref:Phosphoglycerate kinase n=3 Tax=Candidatus Roizmaniibacteriota TaxID=1752723 RepID=A0A2M7E433_9BACT|nr:MAG: phosphoglycerate kinase [Candidatus Roizmanbacteria bacterium CG01_land_8_20_14_3_00_33_9]PIX71848.1 MAG: phosphoglycerate kinase [Candidatus Roizmanbacteria bacterium CG_4_10_14_3_um_filter_33_21]PJB89038.1 MAG: phosphoglycerate kinase [Candidatus Roizmanbacteria bacterium CG_4_9_14_0_8_um_filter_34_12]